MSETTVRRCTHGHEIGARRPLTLSVESVDADGKTVWELKDHCPICFYGPENAYVFLPE